MNKHLQTTALAAALAALAALATSPAALAQASAQGSVSNLSFTLIDLDPGDNWTPTASWQNGSSLISGQIGLGGAVFTPFSQFDAAFGSALSDGAAAPGASAAATLSATGLQVSGQAQSGRSFDATAISGYGIDFGGIVLGAGTGLRMSLDYALAASVAALDPACAPCDSAQVNLTVMLGMGTSSPQFGSAFAGAFGDTGPLDDLVTDSIMLQMNNPGNSPLTLGAAVTLVAQGQGQGPDVATPVPEPGSAALVAAAAGLLLVQRAQRRA